MLKYFHSKYLLLLTILRKLINWAGHFGAPSSYDVDAIVQKNIITGQRELFVLKLYDFAETSTQLTLCKSGKRKFFSLQES